MGLVGETVQGSLTSFIKQRTFVGIISGWTLPQGKEVGVWGKVGAISSISTNFSVGSLLWKMDF